MVVSRIPNIRPMLFSNRISGLAIKRYPAYLYRNDGMESRALLLVGLVRSGTEFDNLPDTGNRKPDIRSIPRNDR